LLAAGNLLVMSTRRKQTVIDDVSLETTAQTDLSFSPEEVSELHTTDDDRFRADYDIGKSGQVSQTLSRLPRLLGAILCVLEWGEMPAVRVEMR